MYWMLEGLLISLIMTLVLELLFSFVMHIHNKKDLILICLVNVITNPVVVLSYYMVIIYTDWSRTLVKLILEISAILVEFYYYKKYARTIKYPFYFSLGANLFSYTAGFVINMYVNKFF